MRVHTGWHGEFRDFFEALVKLLKAQKSFTKYSRAFKN